MSIEFDDFGIPVPGLKATVGTFSGRFYVDTDGREPVIEWIELDGDFKVGSKWHTTPVLVKPTSPSIELRMLFDMLAKPLLERFAEQIAVQAVASLPFRDPYAEHRLTAVQLGVGRYR